MAKEKEPTSVQRIEEFADSASQGLELQPSYSASLAQREIEAAVILAKRFPRNEDSFYQRANKALDNFSFADDAVYSYPRGSKQVEGPSVYLARELAKFWGNMRYGAMILGETDEGQVPTVLGRGYAWDLETNLYEAEDFRVPKLIQRKQKDSGGRTEWVTPDERDLRETVNKYAAIATRNCILRLIRNDYTRDFVEKANQTVEKGIKEDPEKFRKSLIVSFGYINVTVGMLEELLGHKLVECSPAEITKLRQVWKAIHEGQAVWADYVKEKPAGTGTLKMDHLKPLSSQKPDPKPDGLKKVTAEDVKKAEQELRRKKAEAEASSPPSEAAGKEPNPEAEAAAEARTASLSPPLDLPVVNEFPDIAEVRDGQFLNYKGRIYQFSAPDSAWKPYEPFIQSEPTGKSEPRRPREPESQSEPLRQREPTEWSEPSSTREPSCESETDQRGAEAPRSSRKSKEAQHTDAADFAGGFDFGGGGHR